MSLWPPNLTVASLQGWPGTPTPASKRRRSPFGGAPWASTLELLERELRAVTAKETELLVAISPEQFRLDGKPRASARADHPGVILAFTTGVGRLSYPCDRFETWQDNLRAIALALEALRRVDRYGITSTGEQYRGFLALEAGASTSRADAEAFLRRYAEVGPQMPLRDVLARAKRLAHPDTGGSADAFQQILDAERTVRQSGLLAVGADA